MKYTMDGDIHDESQGDSQVDSETKRPFVNPKLTFVEPKLVKQGKLERLTGFFGTFSP